MPQNNLTLGRDLVIVLFDNNTKLPIATANIIEFDAKQETKQETSHPMNGDPRFIEVPMGWKGHFQFDRVDRQLEDFAAYLEVAYYAGQNILPMVINEFKQEPDGTTSQMRYTGVVIKFSEKGTWKTDALVKQKVEFAASRYIRVS